MLQDAASLSDVANVTVERKASRSLQDAVTVEVGGENAKPLRVKKQKHCSQNFMNHRYLDMWLAFNDLFLFLVLVTKEPILGSAS
jgi:hypothetical protein